MVKTCPACYDNNGQLAFLVKKDCQHALELLFRVDEVESGGREGHGLAAGGLGLRWQGLCGLGRQRFDLLRGCWRWLGFVLTRGTAGRLVAEPVQVGKGVPSGVVHEVAFYLVVLVAEAAPGGQESRDAGAEGVAAKLLIPTLPEALVLEGYDVNLEFVAKLLGVKQELLAAGCRTCYARRATSL